MEILNLGELKRFVNALDYPDDTPIEVVTETVIHGDVEHGKTTPAIDVSGHVEHGRKIVVFDLLE